MRSPVIDRPTGWSIQSSRTSRNRNDRGRYCENGRGVRAVGLRMLKRAIQVGAAATAVAAVIAVTGGCGTPEFTYVKNSGQKTYFKVPHDWHQISTDTLDDVLSGTNPDSAAKDVRQQLWWSVAYDAADEPNAAHLLTDLVTDEPIVYARVSQL